MKGKCMHAIHLQKKIDRKDDMKKKHGKISRLTMAHVPSYLRGEVLVKGDGYFCKRVFKKKRREKPTGGLLKLKITILAEAMDRQFGGRAAILAEAEKPQSCRKRNDRYLGAGFASGKGVAMSLLYY